MPTRTQISIYELGIRLSQALELFSEREMLEDELDPLRLSVVTKFGAAFEVLKSDASAPESVVESVGLHLQETLRLWEARYEGQLLIEPLFVAIRSHLSNSRQLLESNFNLITWRTSQAGAWFQFGIVVAAGSGDLTCNHPNPPNWTQSEIDRHPHPDAPIWNWSEAEQVHALSTELQVDETGIFPDYQELLENARQQVDSLPERYWGWASIDRGISKLYAHATFSNAREIHVRVDLNRQMVIIDGDEIQLRSLQHCHFVNALVQASGSWVSGRELSSTNPELHGARFDRILKLLPPQVLALIKSKSGAGYLLQVRPQA